MNRRTFLERGSLLLATSAVGVASVKRLIAAEGEGDEQPLVRLGLLTDLHYADKDSRGTRYYREALAKLERPERNSRPRSPR